MNKLDKIQTNPLINAALLASLAATISAGCGKEQNIIPLDPDQIKKETINTQEKQKSNINNTILGLLSEPETQKKGIQMANECSYQVNGKVVQKIIKIVEEDRTEKKPENRNDLALKALGNLTIERPIATEEKEKIEEYIQIKNNIVLYLANALKEEYKEHLLKTKYTEEANKNENYKTKIRGIIYQAFNPISTNPEIIKNDQNVLKDFLKHPDQALSSWATNKIKSYEIYIK
ncbi:hypothetical protein KKH00_03115, partial [Patescibacteria group bacterium]|nr:hypothetical protein [Patescibacteria group bacterium]